MTEVEYKDLRIKRNQLRDDSEYWDYRQYCEAIKQIKEYDLLLTAYEKQIKS